MVEGLSDERLAGLLGMLLEEQAKREPPVVDEGPIVIMQGVMLGPEPLPEMGKQDSSDEAETVTEPTSVAPIGA